FHNFRVLGMPANVIDPKLRDELIDIFGFEKNFDDTHGSCVYAEFGFSFARMGQPPADILVSLSCDQVQSQNFMWPHKSTGLSPKRRRASRKSANRSSAGERGSSNQKPRPPIVRMARRRTPSLNRH